MYNGMQFKPYKTLHRCIFVCVMSFKRLGLYTIQACMVYTDMNQYEYTVIFYSVNVSVDFNYSVS